MPPHRLEDLLLDTPEADADRAAVHLDERVVTRRELATSARSLSKALDEHGAGRRARVGVMLGNEPEAIAAWFGVFAADSVVVLLNPRLTDAELHRIAEETAVAAIVVGSGDLERASKVAPLVIEARSLEWAAHGASVDPERDPDPDLAIVQFTSGTTGKPKPVPQSHSRMLDLMGRVVSTVSKGDARAREDPMPNLIPVSLSLGAGIYNVLFAFRVGAPVVLMHAFEPLEFAALVKRFGIKSVVLPPPALAMLCESPALADLEPLRYVRSITAPLPPVLAHRFHERFGVAVLNGYGQTEIGGEIIGWSAADWRAHGAEKLGAVGRPHDRIEVRLVGTDGADVEAGAVGELLVRTADAAGVPAAVSDRLDDHGWFRTGDLARIDDDGFVWIEGRVSDMINRGGLKVFPEEVEDVLRGMPDVRDVAVVGVPDDRLGEVPWAFVVPRGSAVDEAALERWSRDHLVAYKVPVRFVGIEELPRNEIGKLRRLDLVRAATSTENA